jgi:branched-chain amino acid transport system permease protein
MAQLLQQLLNGVSTGAIYALVALGYTMVYGTLQLINFAHSEVFMMGAFASLYVAHVTGVEEHPTVGGIALVVIAAMAFCTVLGVAVERLAYRPLRRSSRLNMLITAIGMSLLLKNVALLVVPHLFRKGNAFLSVPPLIEERTWSVHGVQVRSNDLVILGVTLVLMVGLTWIVERTQVGRAMRAVSHSRDAAALMGIPVDRIIVTTFAIGSTLAGAAAFLVAMDKHAVSPELGTTYGLKAFVAAVLGGIGSIPGAVAGAVLLGVSETIVSGYGSSEYRDAIAFVILIVVLLFKPSGLFGKYAPEKV